jgi:hypothetical protein
MKVFLAPCGPVGGNDVMKSDNHADNLVISIVRNFFDAIGLPTAEPCSSAPGEGEFFGPVEWAGILKRAGTGNVPDAEEARLIRVEVERAALLALLQTRVWGLKAVPAGYGIGSEGRSYCRTPDIWLVAG